MRGNKGLQNFNVFSVSCYWRSLSMANRPTA